MAASGAPYRFALPVDTLLCHGVAFITDRQLGAVRAHHGRAGWPALRANHANYFGVGLDSTNLIKSKGDVCPPGASDLQGQEADGNGIMSSQGDAMSRAMMSSMAIRQERISARTATGYSATVLYRASAERRVGAR